MDPHPQHDLSGSGSAGDERDERDVGDQEASPARQELHPHGGDWLREIVFGLNDGLVTTLVFLMAVTAVAPAQIALIALGEVLAGGISMALVRSIIGAHPARNCVLVHPTRAPHTGCSGRGIAL